MQIVSETLERRRVLEDSGGFATKVVEAHRVLCPGQFPRPGRLDVVAGWKTRGHPVEEGVVMVHFTLPHPSDA